MSHGPHSYLKLRHGCHKQLGTWYNGFVKPATKAEKRRAARRVRRSKDVPNGNAFKRFWGYWEWC